MDILALLLALLCLLVVTPCLVAAYYYHLIIQSRLGNVEKTVGEHTIIIKRLDDKTPLHDKVAALEQKVAGVMMKVR